MAQILLIAGAAIFGILGTIHLLYTFFTEKFSPYDRAVADAMKSTSPRLTKETSIWRAWIGFNASHSLGAMLLAAVYIPLAAGHFALIAGSLWFSLLPVVLSAAYLYLAKQYWFRVPFFGILISLLCFVGAAWLANS
ncbi:hypothetical protein PVT67_11190 [Gallaecimonas kandeliae]|uniref:LIC_13387 family protein n=1 Tax=Gallaecimonas kandeliae TaxID=3029055 RepID=UPI00264945D8|nr:hypothetical protein [Gallaecimonas kandeliae]WKE64255.1 hypothetical protein PVT67_11190 [Gallaecimonas kandeliae]